jgi:DivIVA domain-containing protein
MKVMKTIFDPEEIALKKFVVRWRGYDTREVETFLRAVGVDFRRLIDYMAAADQPDTTGHELAEVRDEMSRLSSQLDRALASFKAGELTESAGQSGPTASNHHRPASSEITDMADLDWNAELRLLSGGSSRG